MHKLNEVLIVERDQEIFEMFVRVFDDVQIPIKAIRYCSFEEIEGHINSVMEEYCQAPTLICMSSATPGLSGLLSKFSLPQLCSISLLLYYEQDNGDASLNTDNICYTRLPRHIGNAEAKLTTLFSTWADNGKFFYRDQ